MLAALARPLAFLLCAEIGGGGTRPVCAQTDDYFAFTRASHSLSALYVASGAYCGYAALASVRALNVGHRRTSRALASAAVYALLWLALGALELGVVAARRWTTTTSREARDERKTARP